MGIPGIIVTIYRMPPYMAIRSYNTQCKIFYYAIL